MGEEAIRAARRLAAELLLPQAAAVDRAGRIPEAHLAALDASGLTAHAAQAPSLAERVDVTAALAGGCLATAFVWIQQQGALAAVAAADGPAARFAGAIAGGALRAGVAITAVRGQDPLRIRGGRITGSAPWVTGWGLVDVLRVAAVDATGSVRTALLDVGPGMTGRPLALVAANASRTVTLDFDAVEVPEDRELDRVPMRDWLAADEAGLALNGALALGVAERAATCIGSAALQEAVAEARSQLLDADTPALPAVRATCSALAMRAATALAVHDGGRGLSPGSRADRMLREAHFLLAFGSRPAIRSTLLDRFA